MRVTSLVILGLVAVAIGFGVLCFMQWSDGFAPAKTPAEAMEKFREAIQKRRYDAAARYCTRDYAEVLHQGGTSAARLGQVIDAVRAFMKNKELQTDRAVLLLHLLDPFPQNLVIHGAVKQLNDREAVGVFAWEPLPVSSSTVPLSAPALSVDGKMFQRCLTPGHLFSSGGVKLVKEADGWKLQIVPTPAEQASVRYFTEHAPAYERCLGNFRSDMTNGRYDSPVAFEREVLDALKKAR
jgi:hypothetical protein